MAEENKAEVEKAKNRTWHLNKDPNDPRRKAPAEANLSDLNAEDPEKEPEFQNPV